MSNVSLLESKAKGQSPSGTDPGPVETVPSLSWKNSPPTQSLLNVICSILAEEYIIIAKQNPKPLQNQGGAK